MTETAGSKVLRNITPELVPIHLGALRWAQYCKDIGLRAYPRVTLLGRIIDQGPQGAHIAGNQSSELPDDVADFDKAVASLGEIDGNVLRTYYFEWAPVEVMARKRRMSAANFNNTLRRARWRVKSFLDGLSQRA